MNNPAKNPLIIDAHEDLAYNILTFGRDYRRSAMETRRLEAGGATPERNGDTLLGFAEYQQARVGVVFGTLFVSPVSAKVGEWDIQAYATPDEAHKLYRAQAEVYQRLHDEQPDYFRLLRTLPKLRQHLAEWQQPGVHPVGLVILMEGAEGVRSPGELGLWWDLGVRMIGPAWTGTRFCGGTRMPGPLTPDGYELLEAMAKDFSFVLDISHMDAQAARQALDFYPKQVIASHANALVMVKGSESNRHLPDDVMRGLIERQGVMGIVPMNSFLKNGWKRGSSVRAEVTLENVAAQIDYVCQMAGNARHVAIGTDFDGGFGVQSVPEGLDTIADLPTVAGFLQQKGYSAADQELIFSGNWLRILEAALPEAA